MVFQNYALYPHLSVARNLGFGLRVRHRSKQEVSQAVNAVADLLQLSPLLDRKPRELSGGQRQRVAVGRAIVRNPKVFLMDEPLSNLDAKLRTATRLELADLHRRLGTTFVYVTHDQVEAMTMGTKIAVLNAGRLEQLGSPAEVYDQPASTFVATFLGAPPMNLLPATARSEGGRVRIVADGVDMTLWYGDLEDRPVLVGVRPEHLRLVTSAHDGPRLDAMVTAVENLGSEEVAFCTVGDHQVAVRGSRPLGTVAAERVVLGAGLERIYLFDPATTRRLIWVDDTPDVGAPHEAATARKEAAVAM
jgi:multiple sugar transport system ATP-binding protein